jgi:Xaa-Pro aminopeptidase
MKKDLDIIMKKHGIDAMLITGPGKHNPAMVYLTGGAHLTGADLIVPAGKTGVLFHGPMERDEAKKTGFRTVSYNAYPFSDFLKESGGSRIRAFALRYQHMLEEADIRQGRIALYGLTELGFAYDVMTTLKHNLPEIEFISGVENDFLMRVMATKSKEEIDRIRRMGRVTVEVVAKTADFLTGHRVKNNHLINQDGEPLTIGDVKKKINLWLAEHGAENPNGTIFAIGHDAGVPHSDGGYDDYLKLGQTIVYDIFPCEAGGGYFYDFTRTWCLGYATDEALSLYDQVKSAYHQITNSMVNHTAFKTYQDLACDIFEAYGHPTIRTNPTTEVGYVHSIGHGVGLHIHELPTSGNTASPEDLLLPGSVVTIEPGLYYPDRDLGVRLENTLAVAPDGKIEVLAEYPMDLILPLENRI